MRSVAAGRPATVADRNFGMVPDTLAEVDPAFEERVTASAARVLRLKAATGLLECGEN